VALMVSASMTGQSNADLSALAMSDTGTIGRFDAAHN
jgi:hypothetical protein